MTESDRERECRLILEDVLDYLKTEDPAVRSRKEKVLQGRIGMSRQFVQERREGLIAQAALLRPDIPVATLATWVDSVLKVEPIN